MSDVLAVLEQRDGALRKVSHEVVTGARRLADALGGGVDALVLAAGAVQGAEQVGRFGADKVITLTNAAFGLYAPEGYARAIAERVKSGTYGAVTFAASATGKDLAPRVAARLGRPLAQDVTDVDVQGGAVTVTRPVYAGKALLKLKITGTPAMISLRPSVFTPVERPKAATQETAPVESPAGRVVVKQIKAAEAGTLDVAEAPIIVSGGRGLKEPANFKVLEEPSWTPVGARTRNRWDRPARRSAPPCTSRSGSPVPSSTSRGCVRPKSLWRSTRTKTPRSSRWRTTESWGICSTWCPSSPKR